jgi:hypothetical protein
MEPRNAVDTAVPIGRADAESSGAPEWEAPWVATPEHPGGAADQRPPPQTSTGHYGTGYLDPTRHYGDTLPGQPGENLPPERMQGEGGAIAGDAPEAGEVASPDACPTPAAPAIEDENLRR